MKDCINFLFYLRECNDKMVFKFTYWVPSKKIGHHVISSRKALKNLIFPPLLFYKNCYSFILIAMFFFKYYQVGPGIFPLIFWTK